MRSKRPCLLKSTSDLIGTVAAAAADPEHPRAWSLSVEFDNCAKLPTLRMSPHLDRPRDDPVVDFLCGFEGWRALVARLRCHGRTDTAHCGSVACVRR